MITALDAERAEKNGRWLEATRVWAELATLKETPEVLREFRLRLREAKLVAQDEISAADDPLEVAIAIGGTPVDHPKEDVVVHCPHEGFTLRTDGAWFFFD